ncbi:MAG: DUF87 domain-containing protein [Desulfurococcaceae archaeon]
MRGVNKSRGYEWYRLQGVSFAILSYEERDSVLSEFSALLGAVKRGAVLVRRIPSSFKYSGYEFAVVKTEFYLRAERGSQVLHFNAEKVKEVDRPQIKRLVNPYTLLLDGGQYARVLAAYKFPALLPEGFLYTLFSEASEIALVFREVERSRAVSTAELARKRRLTSASGRVEDAWEAGALEELATRVLAGSSLFEHYLLITISAYSVEELATRERAVRVALKGFGLEAEAPPIQEDLYRLNPCPLLCVEKRYADGESLKALFPLVDEELQDVNGVFLGVSGTGSPVLIDVWSKHNLNFVVAGVTGSGKSVTAKVYLKRLRELDRKIVYVGVDPESEYTRVARHFGAQAVEIGENQGLGLDPIKLMREGALEISQVSDVLAEIYGVPERLQGVLRKELFLSADFLDDVTEFASSVKDSELARYLQGATVPPDLLVYEGNPPPLGGSTIFGLRNVRSKRLKVLISALISAYAYSKLLTRAQRSVFFVDEAWLFMETPSIINLFEDTARRGRKHGVAFIYISQRAEDLARSPQGRAILEQSSTVLLLRQEPQGRDAVREIYKLSSAEADYLVSARVGSGILKASRKRITLQVLPTQEELELFSTTVQ